MPEYLHRHPVMSFPETLYVWQCKTDYYTKCATFKVQAIFNKVYKVYKRLLNT